MQKRLLILSIIVIISVGIVASSGWFYVQSHVNRPIVPDSLERYTFTVEAGEGVASVLQRLKNQGFLTDTTYVSWYLRIFPEYGRRIQAGEYTLSAGQSAIEVLNSLRGGKFEQVLIFIEGWRREQYVTYLVKEMGEDFAREFDEITIEDEGRLFPDTYFIDSQTTPAGLAAMMKENFSNKTDGLTKGNGLSDEQIIIASIIEREVVSEADRALVAGVLTKRLGEGWMLGADATLQYAMATREMNQVGRWQALAQENFNWWPKVITFQDLALDSPYNTRKNVGLPPAPIANPGLTALRAVAAPLQSEYYYYISDKDGITRYAATEAEHNANISRYGLAQ